jgi:Replication factor RFC1 C terminal domain
MTHMNARVTGDRNAIRLNYMPVLARTLTAPLRTSGVEGVPAATALLDEYGLSRDDLFESLGDFTFTVSTCTCAADSIQQEYALLCTNGAGGSVSISDI